MNQRNALLWERGGSAKAHCRVIEPEESSGTRRERDDRPECFRCGKPSHISRDCRIKREAGRDNRPGCFRCGKPGHLSRDCRMGGGTEQDSRPKCFHCGKPGHFSRECKIKRENQSKPFCNFCKISGHNFDNCRKRKGNDNNQDLYRNLNSNKIRHMDTVVSPNQTVSKTEPLLQSVNAER